MISTHAIHCNSDGHWQACSSANSGIGVPAAFVILGSIITAGISHVPCVRRTTGVTGKVALSRIARLTSVNESVRISGARLAGTEMVHLTDLVVVFSLYDFLAAIKAVRADVVAQMYLTGGGFNGQRRISGPVVRAAHVAL